MAFYPTLGDAIGQRTLALAQELEARREGASSSALRGMGVPRFAYERRGAVDPVVELYAAVRAWGYAR